MAETVFHAVLQCGFVMPGDDDRGLIHACVALTEAVHRPVGFYTNSFGLTIVKGVRGDRNCAAEGDIRRAGVS
jgi:hypothetical protein